MTQLPLPPSSGRLGIDTDIDQALDDLRRAFPGLCIWFGEWSGSLWALLPDHLVEAKTSADLVRRLHAALSPPRPPLKAPQPATRVEHLHGPGPSTRCSDGSWSPSPAPRRRPARTRLTVKYVLCYILTSSIHMQPALPR